MLHVVIMMLAIETYKLGIRWSIKITPLDQGYSRVVFGGRTVFLTSIFDFQNNIIFFGGRKSSFGYF